MVTLRNQPRGVPTSTRVFVSYAREDTALVLRVIRDLREAHLSVWWDQDSIPPGTPDWQQAVRDALDLSEVVVLIATPSSANSPTVHGELQHAWSRGRPIIPLWAVGNEWSDCVPLNMVNWQHIDCRESRYVLALPNILVAIKGIAEPRVSASLTQSPEAPTETTAATLVYRPLRVLVVRFVSSEGSRLAWATEDRDVDVLVGHMSRLQHIGLKRTHVSSTQELLSVLKSAEHEKYEVVQFSGDMAQNVLLVMDPASQTDQESVLDVETFGRYLNFALPESVRLLLFISCFQLPLVSRLAPVAPYMVAVEALYPSTAPMLFVREFYQSYFEHRSVHGAFDYALLQLEAQGLAHNVERTFIKRERFSEEGRLLMEVQIEGLPDTLTMDLSPVAQSLASFGIPREQLMNTLATKVRAHRAIFRTPRENAILAVGPILYGMFSWNTSAGYIRCSRLFKFREDANPLHWREWCRLLLIYNALSSEDYRTLSNPGEPTARTSLMKAVNRFISGYDTLSASIRILVGLGFRAAEFSFISGQAELDAAKQSTREQNWPMTVTHLETALTTLHDILKSTMPALETGM